MEKRVNNSKGGGIMIDKVGIVDRLEGDFVIVEIEGEMKEIHYSLFTSGVKEGDVVTLVNGNWSIDLSETTKRKKKIKKLMDDLWSDE